jgi:hypothetical protein
MYNTRQVNNLAFLQQFCNTLSVRSLQYTPSNREGFEDSFGGLRAVLIFLPLLLVSPQKYFQLLQIGTNQSD